MDHQHKPHDVNHEKGFFEAGFSNFFNSCSCVGGRKNKDDEKSSMGSRKDLLRYQLDNEGDHYSSASNNLDWVDLDDGQHNMTNDETINYGHHRKHDNEYETLEPIDFDYLKKITGGEEEDQVEKSIHSGLSKSSKKISKSKKESTKETTPVKGAASKAKGKRNPWQPHEDAKLLELVDKHGQSWSLISSLMEGRTGKQIRDRYLNILRPNIKKGDWTPYEDQQILALYYQFGHKWSKIASYVPNRTEGQVKNRFYSHIKKKILVNDVTYDSNNDLSQGATPNQMSFNSGYHQDNNSRNLTVIPDSVPPSQNISPSNAQTPYNYASSQPSFFHPADDMISYSGPQGNDAGVNYNNANQQQHIDGSPMSQGSTGTHSSHYNPNVVYNENDVDNVLGRIAVYFDRHPSVNSQTSEANMTFGANEDALSKMNKAEQLSKRKQTLEYLLAQTMREMNTFTGK